VKIRRRPWLIGLAALPILVALAFWRLAPTWHPSTRLYPFQGIDVSHHQGRIAWGGLKAQGVDFAYIKASEGGDHRDRAFARNWEESRRAGIRRGAYHFFTLCRSGAEQAANFIAAVPVDAQALAPAVDLEYMGNCTKGMTREQFPGELRAFIQRVEAHYRRPVVLYLTEEFDDFHRVSAHFPNPLWLRSLVLEPRFGARPWNVWQASNFRRLDGVEGRVDWNVARP
jgi:lysozyme